MRKVDDGSPSPPPSPIRRSISPCETLTSPRRRSPCLGFHHLRDSTDSPLSGLNPFSAKRRAAASATAGTGPCPTIRPFRSMTRIAIASNDTSSLAKRSMTALPSPCGGRPTMPSLALPRRAAAAITPCRVSGLVMRPSPPRAPTEMRGSRPIGFTRSEARGAVQVLATPSRRPTSLALLRPARIAGAPAVRVVSVNEV